MEDSDIGISRLIVCTMQLRPPSHKGIVRMIGMTFVRQGILNSEDSQLIGRLFTMRQTGDYEDLFDWKESDVSPMYIPVKDYIERIESIISTKDQHIPLIDDDSC